MMTETSNPLIGKHITAVYLAKDKKAIKFDIEGGEPVIAKTDGDCCSSTWIENVENWQALIGSPVADVQNIDMPNLSPPLTEENRYDDVTAYYGLRITTGNGDCVLDYRNESNGYYGGDLSWPGDHFYGGVFGQNVSKEEWELLS